MLLNKTAIVIGSGVAGMATAARLANSGYSVTVFEAADAPGGKLAQMSLNGYRFDLGPSLFTLPHLVEDLIRECGQNPADYIEPERLDVVCKYFYPDGTRLTAFADTDKFAAEVEAKTGEPKANVLKHLQHSKLLWDLTADVFIFNAFGGKETWLSKKFWKSALSIHKMDVLKSMHKANSDRFQSAKVVQLFDRYATYNGSNPYRAPGVLNVIPHVEYGTGAYLPKGGMYSITKALHKLGQNLGVHYQFNSPVSRIVVEQGRAVGVVVNGTTHKADVVVSNMDAALTYRRLLSDENTAGKILQHERSTSALVFNWGIKKEFAELDLHNIFFAENYKAEFESLFEKKEIYQDPTIYVFIGSKKVKTDAPQGAESWFVMVNAPEHTNQNWNEVTERMREVIIEKLNKQLGIDLRPYIECEWVLTPQLIESRTSSLGGALYGTSSNSRLAAFFRHKNYSNKINNLYFCGGSVHPGGGIPICLASAKITANTILKRK